MDTTGYTSRWCSNGEMAKVVAKHPDRFLYQPNLSPIKYKGVKNTIWELEYWVKEKGAKIFKFYPPEDTYINDPDIWPFYEKAEELDIEENTLPFVSDGSKDIFGILSRILQIGDAVWFTIERKSFKSHLFHVSINEDSRGSIFGETINVDVTRDIVFYLKTYGGKLSAVTGLALPILSFLIPF